MQGVMLTDVTHPADWVLILPVVLCLLGAAVLLMLRSARDFQFLFALLVVGAVLWCEAALLLRVVEFGPLSMTMGRWLPPFGISFTADLLGAGFAATASLVTLVVMVYLRLDMPERARQAGAYPLILLLLAGVSGAFLTGDLFNLYVWFEVMLIASFGLMALGGQSLQLDGTVKYGFLNFLATVFFLIALGLLYGLTGTLNMADIIARAPLANPAAMGSVSTLLLLAFGMKAAAFPVNAWLPASYHTPPAAISALLAGLLTKVGLYAMLRTLVMLLPESRDLLDPVLSLLALLTLLLGPMGAIAETNLRRALGFLVIGGIGAAMAGIALPNPAGLAGTATYMLHAMLTITALYMLAGLIEALTGASDTRQMGGLYGAATWPSILFFILMLAVAGVPPFLGFWPKLLLVEGGIADWQRSGDWTALLLWLGLLVNALLTLIAVSRLWGHIFWRSVPEGQGAPPRLDRRQLWLGLLPTAALTGLVVLAGLAPEPLLAFGKAAAAGMTAPSAYIEATGLAGDLR